MLDPYDDYWISIDEAIPYVVDPAIWNEANEEDDDDSEIPFPYGGEHWKRKEGEKEDENNHPFILPFLYEIPR